MAGNAKVARKLTTILSADIAGYSTLMEVDEAEAMAGLREARSLLIAFIERHEGRVVNTAGDGLLAEFKSVVEAVLCAIEVQRELAAGEPRHNRQMRYRIGINLGDVMVENGDLFGEGVNVAARLQGLAEPSGIMISGPVHDLVQGKLAVGYQYLGPQPVKNMSMPVLAYRVALNAANAGHTARGRSAILPTPGGGSRHATHPDGWHVAPTAGIALALAGLSLIPELAWTAWISLFVAYGAVIGWMRRKLSGRAHIAAQLCLAIALLFGINLLSGSRSWWSVYPALVLAISAFAIHPQGPAQILTWLRRP